MWDGHERNVGNAIEGNMAELAGNAEGVGKKWENSHGEGPSARLPETEH